MAPAAIAEVVVHPNHPTAAAPNAVPRLPPGNTKNAETAMMAHAVANTRNIPRQPISSFSHPPTIRPAMMPADIPAVTMPRTAARRWGFAKRPATELNCAPTDDPAPTTPSDVTPSRSNPLALSPVSLQVGEAAAAVHLAPEVAQVRPAVAAGRVGIEPAPAGCSSLAVARCRAAVPRAVPAASGPAVRP
jgi:hypothetical protein